MTKKFIPQIFLGIFFIACTGRGYEPGLHLTLHEQKIFVQRIIRLAARTPESLGSGDRFDARYDSFYLDQASKHQMEAYFKNGKREYFMLSRPAPSLFEKRVAIGGYVVFNEQGGIDDYEELFRTWKMVPDTLKRRSSFLFEKMVKGESLKPWETVNSGGIEFIEFPDDRTYFDKASRTWKMR
ncbi:MAG: hypothetical protein FJZ78_03220 [Bacteroidetes bacterium]|nr:hypothetical protein [Bacteroidota bacterium]